MTRIGQVDQILLMLRERLQRLERSRGERAGGAGTSERATPGPMARLKGLAALDQLADEEFKRTMVRALLTEELGDSIAGDPAFQGVVDDVFRIIADSEDGRALIDRAAAQLRAVG